MNGQKEFLEQLVGLLEEADIDYMVSGSLGSSFHGEPRATNDIDIVISPTHRQLEAFIESLGDDYYISSEAAFTAVAQRSMFNIIDTKRGLKADLIIRKHRLFSKEEFARRRSAKIMGVNLFMVSPEDSILSKLEWCKNSNSERQFQDAVGVAAIQRNKLDMNYLRKWAQELMIVDLLEKLLSEIENLSEQD